MSLYDVAVLVTGDGDYIPVVREGRHTLDAGRALSQQDVSALFGPAVFGVPRSASGNF